MKFLVHPSTFGNQHRVHLNSGICCSNNRDHFWLHSYSRFTRSFQPSIEVFQESF